MVLFALNGLCFFFSFLFFRFDLKQLLSNYQGQVEFIEGSPAASSDLERVSADKASAFFLLADQAAEVSWSSSTCFFFTLYGVCV